MNPRNCNGLFQAALFTLGALVLAAAADVARGDSEGWTAYNDCVDTTPNDTPANAMNYGLGRSYQGAGDSGNLHDFETGEDTGVTATFTENLSAGNSINWATDAADFTAGTDAEQTFGGILNLSGNMSYNDSPGWSLDLTFSNLDPAVTYTFAATVHRNGGQSYRNRITNWTIMDAEAFTYASTEGAHRVNEASVEFSTGHNPEGLVARWTDIEPGPDGSFTIRTSHGIGAARDGIPGADSYRGYAGGLFLLEAQPGPPRPLDLLRVDHDALAEATTLTWTSQPGDYFEIRKSLDLTGDPASWPLLMTQVPAAASPAVETALTVDTEASEAAAFYKVFRIPPPPLFQDDFESDLGWITGVDDANGDTLWQRGSPSGVGPPNGAGGSVNCFGTNLNGNYAENADTWLRSPPIDLTGEGLTGARLTLQHFPAIERTFDAGAIRVLRASDNSPLGAPLATGIDEANFQSEWQPFAASFPAEALGEVVRVEFRFESDDFTNLAGWYLDDVVVAPR